MAVGVPVAYLLASWSKLTMPFWYNEYWRAYYISEPSGWWQSLKVDGAPFPAGWYFTERFAGQLFGSTELVLRLPTATFLPVTGLLLLLLARRWMPLPAAVAVALVGSLTGDLLTYSVQLSEYVIDAAAVCAIVLLHEIGDDSNSDSARRSALYLCYSGIAVACIFSTPAMLVVASPILLLDVVRDLRTGALGRRTLWAVGAGAIALLHLGLFVLRQNALTKTDYWDSQFLPHHGLGSQITFVYDGIRDSSPAPSPISTARRRPVPCRPDSPPPSSWPGRYCWRSGSPWRPGRLGGARSSPGSVARCC